MNLRRFLTDREKLHRGLMFLWIVLVFPTLLFWPDSVLWVLMISIYANIVGHWSAAEAAKAAKNAVE